MVIKTDVKHIVRSLKAHEKSLKSQDGRIDKLENFNSNLAGKFTVIGAVVIMGVNFLWDIGSDIISKLRFK